MTGMYYKNYAICQGNGTVLNLNGIITKNNNNMLNFMMSFFDPALLAISIVFFVIEMIVSFSSMLMNFVLFGMAFLAFSSPMMGNTALLIVIIGQAMVTLFSLITLPVEIDASRRGLSWLDQAYIARTSEESAHAKDALK